MNSPLIICAEMKINSFIVEINHSQMYCIITAIKLDSAGKWCVMSGLAKDAFHMIPAFLTCFGVKHLRDQMSTFATAMLINKTFSIPILFLYSSFLSHTSYT